MSNQQHDPYTMPTAVQCHRCAAPLRMLFFPTEWMSQLRIRIAPPEIAGAIEPPAAPNGEALMIYCPSCKWEGMLQYSHDDRGADAAEGNPPK